MLGPIVTVKNETLKGVELKVDRANEHVNLLDREMVVWNEKNPSPVRLGFKDDPSPRLIPIVVEAVDQPEPRMGIIIGDVLHNLRCALDYIAFQLVAHGGDPKKLETDAIKHVKFPIVVGPTRRGKAPADYLSDGLRNWLPGIRPVHKTIVRRHQPYVRGQSAETHPLALLQKLSNTDKHRRLQPVLMLPTEGGFRVVQEPLGCRVIGLKLGPGLDGPFRVGAEVCYVTVADKTLCDGLEVQPSATVTVAFEPGLDPVDFTKAFPVIDVLNWISHEVADVLGEIDAVL